MRGADAQPDSLFSYVSCEARVPQDHPLRVIRAIVDEVLVVLSDRFETLYSAQGRPSILPEKLLRALLLQAFFGIRSERQLMEQLDYNLLFLGRVPGSGVRAVDKGPAAATAKSLAEAGPLSPAAVIADLR